MEILAIVTQIAVSIGALWGAFKAIAALGRWVRSWTLIKRKDFDRLKTIEAEHQKCAVSGQIPTEIEKPYEPLKVYSEFDPRVSFKNSK